MDQLLIMPDLLSIIFEFMDRRTWHRTANCSKKMFHILHDEIWFRNSHIYNYPSSIMPICKHKVQLNKPIDEIDANILYLSSDLPDNFEIEFDGDIVCENVYLCRCIKHANRLFIHDINSSPCDNTRVICIGNCEYVHVSKFDGYDIYLYDCNKAYINNICIITLRAENVNEINITGSTIENVFVDDDECNTMNIDNSWIGKFNVCLDICYLNNCDIIDSTINADYVYLYNVNIEGDWITINANEIYMNNFRAIEPDCYVNLCANYIDH